MDTFLLDASFKSLFNDSNIGIIIVDQEGNICAINPYGSSLFGYSEQELIGEKVELLLPNDLRKNHVSKREGYVKDPKPRPMGVGMDLRAQRKDGSTFNVEISLSSYRDNNKVYVVGFINDVTQSVLMKEELNRKRLELEVKVAERTKELSQTLSELAYSNESLKTEMSERKKVEMQVRESLEKEKELNELKTRFVSTASHEFRTPLGGILSSASLLEKYTEEAHQEKRLKHIKTIKKSVKNLTVLLDDFLSIDKLEQNKVTSHPARFSFNEFVQNTIGDLRDITKEGQEIFLELANDEAAGEVFHDQDVIRNILNNLISNAIKYSAKDGKIFIRVKPTQAFLELEIEDQGIGIPESEQKHLFERFFRASNVSTTQGTGLGLSIVKKYLDMIDGEISYKTEVGVGTTFFLKLPREFNYE